MKSEDSGSEASACVQAEVSGIIGVLTDFFSQSNGSLEAVAALGPEEVQVK
jgi:hypothetical protein